jgi:hypothetical protein
LFYICYGKDTDSYNEERVENIKNSPWADLSSVPEQMTTEERLEWAGESGFMFLMGVLGGMI